MGLNLRRVDFPDWIEISISKKERQDLIHLIYQNIPGYNPNCFPYDDEDEDFNYPRVGSYGVYNTFRVCLEVLTGDPLEIDISDFDNFELRILDYFKENLENNSIEIPYVRHILLTSDCENVLLPVAFDQPFWFHDFSFSSSIGVMRALESFADALNFNLCEPIDQNELDPITTAKNVSKIIYQFINEKPDVVVEFC